MLSRIEENYLKAIYILSKNGSQDVLTNELAKSMQTKAASVTDMIKRLFSKKLINYKRYHGVNMTPAGTQQALQIIRKHRLWETFLVQVLDFAWDQVHEVAEQLEHIRSQHLIEKLDKFLGYPKADPHGDPIPNKEGKMQIQPRILLEQLSKGCRGTIVAVKDSDSELLKYLEKIGAKPGKKISVLSKEKYDKSMKIALDGNCLFISQKVAQNILVTH